MVNRVLEAYKALDLGVLEFFNFSSISFIFGEEEVWAEKGEGGKGFWGGWKREGDYACLRILIFITT